MLAPGIAYAQEEPEPEPQPEEVAPPVVIPPATRMAVMTPPEVRRKVTWHEPVTFMAGGFAVLSLGAMTLFGLKANSSWSAVESSCQDNLCTSQGRIGWEDAQRYASAATVSFALFLGFATAGVVTWLTR